MVLARRPVRGRARLASVRLRTYAPGISLHESRGPFSARDDLLKPASLRSHDFHTLSNRCYALLAPVRRPASVGY